eukprot:scaffold25207_cov74-Phaeocystis_antarctica.AAC.1
MDGTWSFPWVAKGAMKTSRPVDARLWAAGEDPGLQSEAELGAEYTRPYAIGEGPGLNGKVVGCRAVQRTALVWCTWLTRFQLPALEDSRGLELRIRGAARAPVDTKVRLLQIELKRRNGCGAQESTLRLDLHQRLGVA